MDLHKRDFFPREFECGSMRAWDNYFWWVELSDLPERNMVAPASWPPPRSAQLVPVEGRILENNRVSVRSGAGRTVVWLAPEMVDFGQRVSLSIDGRSRRLEVKPSSETLLEDVRTRGDRQHPFWAKVEGP
jgi:hypothetical protein